MLKRGPSTVMTLPPRWSRPPAASVASASAALRWGQNGWATATWATRPLPKNERSRVPLVKSKSWSGTTISPGAKSSRSEPQALTETM